jgi:hypothetical protein
MTRLLQNASCPPGLLPPSVDGSYVLEKKKGAVRLRIMQNCQKTAWPHAKQSGVRAQSEHIRTKVSIRPPVLPIINRYIIVDAFGTNIGFGKHLRSVAQTDDP